MTGAPAALFWVGADDHCLSSICGISQVARNASAAIGTATRKTVWIDSA